MAINQFKVKLRSQVSKIVIAFDVTPEITETRNVNYKTLEPVHMPGGIHVYGNTSSRIFNINNIRLVSRSREEASKNLWRLNVLRSWAMPHFGISPSSLIGAPPDVLSLHAYSTGPGDSSRPTSPIQPTSDTGDGSNATETSDRQEEQNFDFFRRLRPTNIHNIPCVMQQISIPYPSDTDYIETVDRTYNNGDTIKAGVPFPTIMTVDMVLMETHSPREFASFDLKKYRQGRLDTF